MTAVALFAGCGGASIGLKRAGLDVVLDVERDLDACKTLTAAGLRPWCVDLADVAGHMLPGADLWWASPPCQPDSAAGKRLGSDDPRDGWGHVWRLLDEASAVGKAPRWLLCETVRGILPPKRIKTDAHRRRAARWEGILAEARRRFGWVDWRVLDAADYGVPQHRRRVILVCGSRPIVWPEPTHGPGRAKPWVTMGEALGLTGARVVGGGHNPSHPGDVRRYNDLTDRPSTTIAAQPGGGAGNAGPFVVGPQGVERPPWWHRASPPDEPSRTVGAKGNASVLLEPSRTVLASESKGASQRGGRPHPKGFSRASDQLAAGTGQRRRRLTIEECLVLQGLAGHPVQGSTKASRYRQAGNAVPPRLAEAVALAVRAADGGDQ